MKAVNSKIIKYIESNRQATVSQLSDYLGITRQAVHRRLSKLFSERIIYKIGKPPKVFYLIRADKKPVIDIKIDFGLKKVIDENFLIITPAGEREEGFKGFTYWCDKQKLPIEKTAREYVGTLKKYAPYKKDGLINGMYKLKRTFDQVFLAEVFYLDFYSLERFGKTKLGQMLLYAKQSQNKILIKELVQEIKPRLDALIKRFQVQAVGFIPPTVRREIQLMKELERQLNLSLPIINLVKVKTPVAVPQKTLAKLEDRVENAKQTIIVQEARKFKTILLLDDALGSGATLNETASKIKTQNLAEIIIGLAITGSFSGFEVISEV